MNKIVLCTAIVLGAVFSACTRQDNAGLKTQEVDTTASNVKEKMKNLISIVEIPTTDFQRAVAFYQSVLDIKIEETEMEGIKMGLFPNAGEGVFVQLIEGSEYKPSTDGTVVYLHGGDDLQRVADKIEANGGKLVVPKTGIGPEMGFFAIFIDTEGNKLGLHSAN